MNIPWVPPWVTAGEVHCGVSLEFASGKVETLERPIVNPKVVFHAPPVYLSDEESLIPNSGIQSVNTLVKVNKQIFMMGSTELQRPHGFEKLLAKLN